MLESMEGRRGMPRLRPPFPAQSGYLGRPTLINNVETLAHVALILRGDWQPARPLVRVSGAVAKPGCYEAPLDITLRELIEGTRAGFTAEPGAIVPGGAASGILPPDALDTPLTREALAEWGCGVGSAAVQVFPADYSPRRLLAETMRFFAEESCQKCTPCRIGNRALHAVFEGERTMTPETDGRVARGDDADLDLRPRPGGADPGPHGATALAGAVREDVRMIEFTLDGQRASAADGELLVHAAARNGVFIPTLCHDDKLAPYGGCRMCVVGVEGAPRPLPACATRVDRRHGRLHQLERAAAAEDADRDAARRAPERRSGRPPERAHRPRRRARRRSAVHPPRREARAVRRPQPADGLRAGHVHPLQPLRPLHAGGDAVLGALARGPRRRGADRADVGQELARHRVRALRRLPLRRARPARSTRSSSREPASRSARSSR